MKNYFRSLCRCLSFVLLFALFVPLGSVAEAAFPDVSDDAVKNAATLLQNLDIVAGYPDGNFHPADRLTRAQFCKMAVLLMGRDDAGANYTLFPDVKTAHWAHGYVNTAVRELKIIQGFPDGRFKPDDPITYAQAVTILTRLLGYTDADVGLDWPRGYLAKAAAIGLTKDIMLSAEAIVDRGVGARLFYQTLFSKTKEAKNFSESLGIQEIEDVYVLNPDAEAPSGTKRGTLTLSPDGKTVFYPNGRGPSGLASGAKGTLYADEENVFLMFRPDDGIASKTITVRQANALYVTSDDGQTVNNLSDNTRVYDGKTLTTWGEIWTDTKTGAVLRFFFSANGDVDLILAASLAEEGAVHVLTTAPSGANPLYYLGIPANATIYKNGAKAAFSDLRQYDVLSYDAATNTVAASDFRITALYEDADPNVASPSSITTLGGMKFPVVPQAAPVVGKFKLGQKVTFLFTHGRKIAGALDVSSMEAKQPGLVTGKDEVTLWDGMVVKGRTSNAYWGEIVRLTMNTPGQLTLERVNRRYDVPALDLAANTAGSAPIAPYALFYDRCADGGIATAVSRDRLPDKIPASKVLHVVYDAAGKATLIVLNNVTGDAFVYGILTYTEGVSEPPSAGASGAADGDEDAGGGAGFGFESTDSIVKVASAIGTVEFIQFPGTTHPFTGSIVRVAARVSDGVATEIKTLETTVGVKREDFSGNEAVRIGGAVRALPKTMKVYLTETKSFVTVEQARVKSTAFTVYLDAPLADGGQVRFITAKA